MNDVKCKPLALTDIARRRVVAVLFTKPTILMSISNFHSRYSPYDPNDYAAHSEEYDEQITSLKVWEETVEAKLSAEIDKFVIPSPLVLILKDLIRPMGWQVKKWKEFHEKYLPVPYGKRFSFEVPALQQLRWTASGALDYRKTAEELIRSDAVDIVKKFKLACLYCLKDDIPKLWRELPEGKKTYFLNKAPHLKNGGLGQEFWWPRIIQGQENKLDDLTRSHRRDQFTFRQYAFQCSVDKGNKEAAEYFLKELADEQKQVSLISATREFKKEYLMPNGNYKVFPVRKRFELFSHLLAVMTPDQREQILLHMPHTVIECFLVWPLQDMFLKIAVDVWNIHTDDGRDDMLFFMYKNSENFGENSLKLFEKFFSDIPAEFWTGFADRQSVSRSGLVALLADGRVKPLEICFRNLDATVRKRLALCEIAVNAFKELISKGKPDAVEVCLRYVSLSQEEKRTLKETLKVKGNTRKWSGLVSLLDLNE